MALLNCSLSCYEIFLHTMIKKRILIELTEIKTTVTTVGFQK